MLNSEHFPHLTLFLGGARSGKSEAAENFVENANKSPLYLATAENRDTEMSRRIDSHRRRRGSHWKTLEAPIHVSDVLKKGDTSQIVLLDCLTLWLSNIMYAEMDLDAEIACLLEALCNCKGPVVCVSNELGMGLVPETPLGRQFRDAQGLLNQRVAQISDLVVFVAAGLPLVLKGKYPEMSK